MHKVVSIDASRLAHLIPPDEEYNDWFKIYV